MALIGSSQTVFKKWRRGSVLVTDASWGDSGKGKVVSYLKPQLGVRSVGGHNAGHTIVTNKGKFGLGLIPSTIINPNCVNLIGQGVVISPTFLANEIKTLIKSGIRVDSNNLVIDPGSHLVMPWHQIRDSLSEESKGRSAVGSLKLGVGWAYVDRLDRRGLRISDLLRRNVRPIIRSEIAMQRGLIEELRLRVKLQTGVKSKVDTNIDAKNVIENILESVTEIRKHVANTREILSTAIDKKRRVLFEDAHGAMLDLSNGSWPFTTAVNVGLGGIYGSFGGKAVRSVQKIVATLKAYQTRVGGGPMPTENRKLLGKNLIKFGGEIATRSKRTRRCGPLDIPLTKYAIKIMGLTRSDEIALTKLDVLDNFDEIPVCISYKYMNHHSTVSPSASATFLSKVKPNYVVLPGWNKDTSSINNFKDLPKNAKNYIWFIQEILKHKITLAGVGQHKDSVAILGGTIYNGPKKYTKYFGNN